MHEILEVGASRIELSVGDSLEVMAAMPPGSVDVIATSSPYNIGVDYGGAGYDDSAPREEFLAWTAKWLDLASRILSPEGSLFMNMGGKPTNPLGPEQVLLVAADPKRMVGVSRETPPFILQNKIAWVKSGTVKVRAKKETLRRAAARAELTVGQTRRLIKAIRECEGPDGEDRSIGHSKPLTSDRFVDDKWEVVYHLTKTGSVQIDRKAPGLGVPYEDLTNATRWKGAGGEDLKCRGNVWFIPYKTIQNHDEERPHPAPFPPRLVELCYLLHGRSRISMTMDPFSGIGNSALAAASLGLNHKGIELGMDNHAEAVRRVRALADQVFPR